MRKIELLAQSFPKILDNTEKDYIEKRLLKEKWKTKHLLKNISQENKICKITRNSIAFLLKWVIL